jgi:transcriptional regulator of acetoin/glycerol metabolism
MLRKKRHHHSPIRHKTQASDNKSVAWQTIWGKTEDSAALPLDDGTLFAKSTLPPSSTQEETPMVVQSDDKSRNEGIVSLLKELAQGHVEPLKNARDATIQWALQHTDGNVALAADLLGTSRSTVYRFARTHTAA